jgi:RNA polymerase sigma-70 factor, ECF subfamily
VASQSAELPELLDICLRRGTDRDWEEFVRRVQPAVAAKISATLRRFAFAGADLRDLVDDLMQQTFLRLCASGFEALRKANIRSESALFAYVREAAANITIDHLRRARPPEVEVTESIADTSHSRVDAALLLEDVETQLRRCSEANYERDRRIFWLYYRSDLTSRAIAALPLFGLTQKGVESLLLRLTRCIREAFARKLSQAEGNPPFPASLKEGRALGRTS